MSEWKLDFVFVLDVTPSMANAWEPVKNRIKTFAQDFLSTLASCGETVSSLRNKLITFQDIARYGDAAIQETPFFDMLTEPGKFQEALDAIQIGHGYDNGPENAREALFKAMLSDFLPGKIGVRSRHCIMLVTDAFPYNLGERNDVLRNFTAEDYPENLDELSAIWHASDSESYLKLSRSGKRLILVAPKGADGFGHSWDDVRCWEYTDGADSPEQNDADEWEFAISSLCEEIIASCIRNY